MGGESAADQPVRPAELCRLPGPRPPAFFLRALRRNGTCRAARNTLQSALKRIALPFGGDARQARAHRGSQSDGAASAGVGPLVQRRAILYCPRASARARRTSHRDLVCSRPAPLGSRAHAGAVWLCRNASALMIMKLRMLTPSPVAKAGA